MDLIINTHNDGSYTAINTIGTLISNSVNMPQNYNPEDWEEFGQRMDSLSSRIQQIYGDSLEYLDDN